MTQALTHYRETASQTGGPYVHIGLAPLPGGLRASVGRRNDRRYFYLDPPLALDFAHRN